MEHEKNQDIITRILKTLNLIGEKLLSLIQILPYQPPLLPSLTLCYSPSYVYIYAMILMNDTPIIIL